jgi:hypothetical protein
MFSPERVAEINVAIKSAKVTGMWRNIRMKNPPRRANDAQPVMLIWRPP